MKNDIILSILWLLIVSFGIISLNSHWNKEINLKKMKDFIDCSLVKAKDSDDIQICRDYYLPL